MVQWLMLNDVNANCVSKFVSSSVVLKRTHREPCELKLKLKHLSPICKQCRTHWVTILDSLRLTKGIIRGRPLRGFWDSGGSVHSKPGFHSSKTTGRQVVMNRVNPNLFSMRASKNRAAKLPLHMFAFCFSEVLFAPVYKNWFCCTIAPSFLIGTGVHCVQDSLYGFGLIKIPFIWSEYFPGDSSLSWSELRLIMREKCWYFFAEKAVAKEKDTCAKFTRATNTREFDKTLFTFQGSKQICPSTISTMKNKV